MDDNTDLFIHTVHGAGRLLPSGNRWNSIELDYNLLPTSSHNDDHFTTTSSLYSKSFTFNLTITDKSHFKRFLYIFIALLLTIIFLVLLLSFLPHKHHDSLPSTNLPFTLKQALLFFDAQKSGQINNSLVKFRGDSGLQDGHYRQINASLVGGFYDSGNNVKFSFPTAYTITLLSWTVIEYHEKYEAMNELEHVKDIIKWGTDYLLKLFVPSNSTATPNLIYSQVGSANISSSSENDMSCWQRPEDMKYARPVSVCGASATDLAGEIAAALAAASLVFTDRKSYSLKLIQASESLFNLAKNSGKKQTYTMDVACGGEASNYYNSSGYLDELVWGATWLFFATGDRSYLGYATDSFDSALIEELVPDHGVFYWNNKLAAIAVLMTRLRYLLDPGFPYTTVLTKCSELTNNLMCSYLSAPEKFSMTPAGLILLKPNSSTSLELASTAAFLTKIYSDYLDSIKIEGGACGDDLYSLDDLQNFAESQMNYILGNNPMKMSYVVGVGSEYPKQVYHRGASIPWDGKQYGCVEGKRWRDSKEANPNVLLGAMVRGPDKEDGFSDDRNRPEYTEPSIASNAGLVAALIGLLDHPSSTTSRIDRDAMFANIS
ncbi:endoglucanase 25-like isoform X2 [Dioscorea cayenensis subsp. rotundata]|uniref:cellulase n=1 Tax=Dioscorea cayennensis subsp. rotundata TaxID=55577 RepID=A0AB40ATF7_DIOCR|nr:endoglucanase 25-like isoform X2 [Dioscorea cayenensis subsp. rotundata]